MFVWASSLNWFEQAHIYKFFDSKFRENYRSLLWTLLFNVHKSKKYQAWYWPGSINYGQQERECRIFLPLIKSNLFSRRGQDIDTKKCWKLISFEFVFYSSGCLLRLSFQPPKHERIYYRKYTIHAPDRDADWQRLPGPAVGNDSTQVALNLSRFSC